MNGMTDAQIIDTRAQIIDEAEHTFITRHDVLTVLDAVLPAPVAEPLTADQQHALRDALAEAAEAHLAQAWGDMASAAASHIVACVLDAVFPATVPAPAPEAPAESVPAQS